MIILSLPLFAETILLGGLELVVEGCAWGAFGCLFFRAMPIRRNDWYVECSILTLLYSVWDYWEGLFMSRLDISIGNQEFLDIFGGDMSELWEVTPVDYLINALVVCAGYVVGRRLIRRICRPAAAAPIP